MWNGSVYFWEDFELRVDVCMRPALEGLHLTCCSSVNSSLCGCLAHLLPHCAFMETCCQTSLRQDQEWNLPSFKSNRKTVTQFFRGRISCACKEQLGMSNWMESCKPNSFRLIIETQGKGKGFTGHIIFKALLCEHVNLCAPPLPLVPSDCFTPSEVCQDREVFDLFCWALAYHHRTSLSPPNTSPATGGKGFCFFLSHFNYKQLQDSSVCKIVKDVSSFVSASN